jgi:hypothetical protein
MKWQVGNEMAAGPEPWLPSLLMSIIKKRDIQNQPTCVLSCPPMPPPFYLQMGLVLPINQLI